MNETILHTANEKMEKAILVFKGELSKLRTGRASVSILDIIKVDYYGTLTPLNQISSISAPDPRQIVIQPWDVKAIQAIEKAILSSELGLTPVNDGKVVRISVPALTEERRKELTRIVGKMSEEVKVSVRNIRRSSNDELKKIEKEKQISEDDSKTLQKKIQTLTDGHIKKIEELVQKKNKEIMEV
ncbi:MAG: ribosome recycling factor [Deltaproteobacteria bacterium]|nr:ribosome recycling factor [Deltaproteobacteria bacterium]MCL5276840.1 ribosome recycling factor [Deltaproteobacteria bacterium]